MYTVYVLRNEQDQLYKGITGDLEKRIVYHNAGLNTWTRGKGPWVVVYTEEYCSKSEALAREKFLKSGKGREFLKNKLSGISAVG